MAANIYDLSTTAASNTTIDGIDVSGATGKVKDGDNVMRSEAAFMAQWIDDQGGIATTAGSANAQTVTLASGFTANANGHVFTVKIGAGLANTSTTVTLNVNSIAAVRVKVDYGGVIADPIPGDLQGGSYATFLDNGTNFILLNPQGQGRYPPGTLYGLTLSNNSGTPLTKIDIAAGACRDGADSANMDLLAALTAKDAGATWAVGSSAGCLDTGALANNTWYHGWLIKRPDTGVVDFLLSTSVSAPTMPTNYTIKRRIGSPFKTNGSAQFAAFTQVGDIFRWTTPATDRSSTSTFASALLTLTVPTGIVVQPIVTDQAQIAAGGGAVEVSIASAGQTITSAHRILFLAVSAQINNATPPPTINTNTSGQIQYAATQASAPGAFNGNDLFTLGFVDTRGRV